MRQFFVRIGIGAGVLTLVISFLNFYPKAALITFGSLILIVFVWVIGDIVLDLRRET